MPKSKKYFSVNANNNSLDIAVLEWCKLFADKRGKHYWRKIISDPTNFGLGLLKALKMDETQFDDYVNQMRTYRDKFVAHLDSEETMHIPQLRPAIDSSIYLYDYLLANEEEDGCFDDAPVNASDFFSRFRSEGEATYDEIAK